MPPAEVVQSRDVEPFARRAVGLVGVKANVAAKVNDVGDEPGQIGDGDILAGSDVKKVRAVIVIHEKEAGVGQVVDVQEFAFGLADAP